RADGGIGIVDLVVLVQLAPSKGEARRLVQSGGVYVNNRRVTDVRMRVTGDLAVRRRLLVGRKGEKQIHLVRLVGSRGGGDRLGQAIDDGCAQSMCAPGAPHRTRFT